MRFLIVAVLVLGGCGAPERPDPAACRKACCDAGLYVWSANYVCQCGNGTDDKLERLRAIQCGEEPKL